jgi:putative addiction module component (TIGR02574 family)
MAQMTPEVSKVLEKALTLSTRERGLLIDQLIASLDDGPAEEGVEEAWAAEIKQRIDDMRSDKAKMIPGEEVIRRLGARLRNGGSKAYRFHPVVNCGAPSAQRLENTALSNTLRSRRSKDLDTALGICLAKSQK